MKVESHLLHGDFGRCVSFTIEDAKHVETRSVEYLPGQCTSHVKFFLRSREEADAILNAVAKARTLLDISTPLRAAIAVPLSHGGATSPSPDGQVAAPVGERYGLSPIANAMRVFGEVAR